MRKVGINLLWMVPGVVGGSETYMTRLFRGLAERDSDLDYTLFALPQFAEAHTDLATSFKTAYAPLIGPGEVVPGRRREHMARAPMPEAEHRRDPPRRRDDAAGPHHRSILTIHDLQYLFYPEYFTRIEARFLRTMVPRSAEAARWCSCRASSPGGP